ncbi:sigma 54-interacting transcriptional regulator [Clostridiaceae bacterium M8S5]|nr:sigma 54-interacting transcriptional regulator [Clostridiaceae bacterium M8S5]
MLSPNNISYEEFVHAIDELYDEVIIYDNNYKIIYVNNACERHYGMTKEEMIGCSFYDFADEYWSSSVLPYVYKSKKAVKQKQETKLGAKILTIAIPILDDNGEIKYVAMSVRDDIPDNEIQNLFFLEDIGSRSNKKLESQLIYNSNIMEKVVALADHIVDADLTCLITGESGVGKTLIGKYIHENSNRKENPFVHINCAAISKDLFESELYGYIGGSFTGANEKGKKGLAAEANKGTLFLDEISELPYKMQAKLLQFIQDKKFYPVGGTKPIEVDTRIITATNKDLKKMVEMGSFREDLYYRLNVFELNIPPIRQRKDDILVLCDFYLNKYNQKYNKTHRFSDEVKNIFLNYSWKGNIRELSHVVERLVVVNKDVVIRPWHLPKHLYELPVKNNYIDIDGGTTLDELMESYEKDIIKKAYEEYQSTRKISKKLGISQSKASRLYRKYIKGESI